MMNRIIIGGSKKLPKVSLDSIKVGKCTEETLVSSLDTFVIIDQCLDAERQKWMPKTLFTALFVEENRQMETKHSLVDAQNYWMPQTNENWWVQLKFFSHKHYVTHFRASPYFRRQRQQVRFAHLQSKKRSPNPWYRLHGN